MLLGICLILAGILIALYPELLSIVVAALLIFIGTVLALISFRFKRTHRDFSDPFTSFFMRF